MAVTSIHPIQSTLKLAVDYITNPNKTEEQRYVEGYACSPAFAASEFEHTRQFKNKEKGEILAFHLIQSFMPDEATPEQAHEIGKHLADELLKGQYEYVISTHIDKGHIHNHIIINSVNFENGKSFSTEHDRKNNPAWKKIRSISDELCHKKGLSVINNPERGKGKSRYEWEMERNGDSWKAKLKDAIDECIKSASSFDDFLSKMAEKNYEIKQGKFISFRAEGQERFTRSKTIGYYYQEEQIRTRIERRIARKLSFNAQKKIDNPYVSDKLIRNFITIDENMEQSQGLKNWAIVQNMKNASKILNLLAEKGLESEEQLKEKIIDLYDSRLDVQDEIKELEAQMTALAVDIKNVKTYRELRPIHEKYTQAKNKDKFFRQNESDLHLYSIAKDRVKGLVNENGKLPAITVFEKRYEALEQQKAVLIAEYQSKKKEISEIEKLKDNLEKMQENERQQDWEKSK